MSISYNGGGSFLINSAGQPVSSGTTITSTAFNALTADLGTGLSTVICKDGQTTTTARIPFALGINSTLTTDATSISTGSILTAGGVGIAKALWVGGLTNMAGALTNTVATDATSTSTGSIITSGGVGIAKALWVGGLANVAGAVTCQSTLAVTGAATLSSTLQSTTYLSTSSIIYMGGTTASEVSLRRSTTKLQVKLGDDSAYAHIEGADLAALSSIVYLGVGSNADVSLRRSSTTLRIRLGDDSDYASANAANLFSSTGLVYFVGTSAAELLLKRSGTTLLVRKGDDSANGSLTCDTLTCSTLTGLGGATGVVANPSSITVVNGIVTAIS